MEKLEKVIECPICLEILQPPVKLCKNEDVAICENCSASIDRCPSCGEDFYARKNVYVDNMLEAIPMACNNKKNGCRELVTKEDMDNHEKVCNYKITICCVSGCNSLDIVYNKLDQHLKSVHPDKFSKFIFGVFKEVTFFKMAESSPTFYYWIFKEENTGKRFLMKYMVDDKLLFVCAQYLGNRERAGKYLYEVTFDQGQSITYSGGSRCSPYFISKEEMKENRNVLCIDLIKNMFFEKPITELKVKCKIVKNEYFEKVV